MKELHSRGDPSQPRSHRRPPKPSHPQTLPLPAGRKLDKTSGENFRYFLPSRRNHTAWSFCCRVFSRSSHFSRNNAAVLLVDIVRRCFARRSGVKLENNGSRTSFRRHTTDFQIKKYGRATIALIFSFANLRYLMIKQSFLETINIYQLNFASIKYPFTWMFYKI